MRFERLWRKPNRYWRFMSEGRMLAAQAVLEASRARYSRRYDAHQSELDRVPIYTGHIGRYEGFRFTSYPTNGNPEHDTGV